MSNKGTNNFEIKSILIDAILAEKGQFKWKPNAAACSDKDRTREALKILSEMPEDKRTVWTNRLDVDETLATCPVIRQDQDLMEAFAKLFNLQYSSKLDDKQKPSGGEGSK